MVSPSMYLYYLGHLIIFQSLIIIYYFYATFAVLFIIYPESLITVDPVSTTVFPVSITDFPVSNIGFAILIGLSVFYTVIGLTLGKILFADFAYF